MDITLTDEVKLSTFFIDYFLKTKRFTRKIKKKETTSLIRKFKAKPIARIHLIKQFVITTMVYLFEKVTFNYA